jgi:pimeloyl-ACP methyl ester carboxylesterase
VARLLPVRTEEPKKGALSKFPQIATCGLVGREGSLTTSLPLDDETRKTVPVLPETHYAKSGDVSIAYQVMGTGPFDLVWVQGFVSNVELAWLHRPLETFNRQLASFCRLIRFDKRGTGMSDRVGIATLETRMDDVRAVMDAVGSPRAALLGSSEGGPLSLLFAATYPERTRALILWSSFARYTWAPDYPWA